LAPEVVVCLGAVAAKALIAPSFRITKDRGQLLPWTPLVADLRVVAHALA
jgi:DNA polymerase